MNIKAGTYNLGPSDGTVRVRTGREGMAAKAGHDLTFEAANWKATITIDDDPSRNEVTAAIEPRSLEVKAAAAPSGRLTGTATVMQSEFGIKPYSAMLGALKVKDQVEIDLDVVLSVASS